MDYSNLFVVLMGVGTVFVGLVCIVLLVTLMSWLCRRLGKKKSAAPAAASVPSRQSSNAGEILAAISSVIAAELGTDVSAIRITSIKKV